MKLRWFVVCDTQLKSALPSDSNTLLKTWAQFHMHLLGFAVVSGIQAGSAAAGGAAARVLAPLTAPAACWVGEQQACSPSSVPPVDTEERARRQWTLLTSSKERYSPLGWLYHLRWLDIWRRFQWSELSTCCPLEMGRALPLPNGGMSRAALHGSPWVHQLQPLAVIHCSV